MRFFAFFTNGGTPALLLNPTIDVWDSAGNHPINAQPMTEIAGGWYQYNWPAPGYDDTVDYVVRADGGAGLADFERYVYSSNDCDSSMAAHVVPLAIEANVQGHAAAALTAYDPSTRAENIADRDQILAAVVAIEASVFAHVVEGALTFTQYQRIMFAVLAGLSTGGGTNILRFRDLLNTKNRVNAQVDGTGNRIAITRDGT